MKKIQKSIVLSVKNIENLKILKYDIFFIYETLIISYL